MKARLTTLVSVLGVFMLLVAMTGILATREVNRGVTTVYEDRAVPLAQLFEINDRMLMNRWCRIRRWRMG